MANAAATNKRGIRGGAKVKTGCTTCRIRKIKCDENKPSCLRCEQTGRICDGYQSLFKISTAQQIGRVCTSNLRSDTGQYGSQRLSLEIAPEEISLLNRYFSIKTFFNINLDCSGEAKQLLTASMTDSSLRAAISALRVLRKDLETSQLGHTTFAFQSPNYDHGIRQYTLALGGLASSLSSSGFEGLKSALLCCQVFISIEQLQGNFITMTQHIVRGLSILRECQPRPCITATYEVMLVQYDKIPLLDVFIIKIFAAPCKFGVSSPVTDSRATTSEGSPTASLQQMPVSRQSRKLAPNMRTELTRISTLTLQFLNHVSKIASVEEAIGLLSEKATLLEALAAWLKELEFELGPPVSEKPPEESISVSFLRLFHLILKIIVMGTLDTPIDVEGLLQVEQICLLEIARDISDKLREIRISSKARHE